MRQRVRRSTWTILVAMLLAGCGQGGGEQAAAPAQPEGASGAPTVSDTTPSPAEVPADGEPIYIGVAAPFTGDVAQFGASIRKGADLKVEELNAQGGISGRPIELVYQNDAGSPQEAAIVSRKLASDDRITAVVGHFNSSCSLAAKPIYQAAGVLQFSPASTNADVTKGSEWTFRNVYEDNFQGQSLARYIDEKLKLRRVAVFYDNDDYGIGLKESFIAESKERGIEIVGEESFERDTVDFTPQIAKIGRANPEAIIIAGLYTQAAQIAAQTRRAGITVPLLGADGLHSIDLINIGGQATEGMLITVPFLFELGGPNTKAFVGAYRAKYEDEDPDSWAALTYDAVGIVATAIERAGTDRRAIRDAVAAMSGPETGYDGVTGLTYFDENGDTSKPAHVATVRNGAFVPADLQLLD